MSSAAAGMSNQRIMKEVAFASKRPEVWVVRVTSMLAQPAPPAPRSTSARAQPRRRGAGCIMGANIAEAPASEQAAPGGAAEALLEPPRVYPLATMNAAATHPERLEDHVARFERTFGPAGGGVRGGVRLFFAPGRVNLMGAHLDYNGGPVMPMAIDRGTFLAIRPRSAPVLRLRSTTERLGRDVELGALAELEPTGSWSDYPLGVARGLARRGAARG